MRRSWMILLVTCLGGALPLAGNQAEESEALGKPGKPVEIGLCASLFRDVPDSVLQTMSKPFGLVMATQTGMIGHLVKAGDALDLGKQLNEQKLHLGIFHGYEFAWARQKYPDLKPLVIAVNQSRHLRALLIIRSDSELSDFAALKEKALNMPRGNRGHCHLFLEHGCNVAGDCAAAEHLSKITTGACAEEALDEVVDGTVDATIVDRVALDCYKRRKPGRFGELKVAVESQVFPAGVVAYHPGTLEEKALDRFRDGLVNCQKTILGRQLLTMWKLTGFEPIPDDYEQTLKDIVKTYPAPE